RSHVDSARIKCPQPDTNPLHIRRGFLPDECIPSEIAVASDEEIFLGVAVAEAKVKDRVAERHTLKRVLTEFCEMRNRIKEVGRSLEPDPFREQQGAVTDIRCNEQDRTMGVYVPMNGGEQSVILVPASCKPVHRLLVTDRGSRKQILSGARPASAQSLGERTDPVLKEVH